MKHIQALRQRLRAILPRNPLSLLGWLGVIGIFGLFIHAYNMLPFLLCFTFFAYSDMTPDEAFWSQVHRAGSRAFFFGFGFSLLCFLGLVLHGMAIHMDHPTPVSETLVQMRLVEYLQLSLITVAFVLQLILMLCIFSLSMLRWRRREKRALRSEES